MPINKRFVDGKWRWVRPDGSLGRVCPSPTATERRELEAEEGARAAPRAAAAATPGAQGAQKKFLDGKWRWVAPDGSIGRACPPPNAAERRNLEAAEGARAATLSAANDAWPVPVAGAAADGTRRYKVLSQRDPWFAGKFDAARLEEALNAHAAEGWRVVGVASAEVAARGGSRPELVVLLQR